MHFCSLERGKILLRIEVINLKIQHVLNVKYSRFMAVEKEVHITSMHNQPQLILYGIAKRALSVKLDYLQASGEIQREV